MATDLTAMIVGMTPVIVFIPTITDYVLFVTDKEAGMTCHPTRDEWARWLAQHPEEPLREYPKNPHAQAMARLGASKGGLHRAKNLTPAQRTAQAQHAAQVRWAKYKKGESS